MALDITPKKFGVKKEPPTLVLYYVINESGKLHRRSIPVRNVESYKSLDDMYSSLTKQGSHAKYLERLPRKQVTKCLRMLLVKETEEELKNKDIARGQDLNKLSDNDLGVVKAAMDKSFEKSRVKPGDEDWKYDLEEDFDKGVKIESGWDENEESDLEF